MSTDGFSSPADHESSCETTETSPEVSSKLTALDTEESSNSTEHSQTVVTSGVLKKDYFRYEYLAGIYA